MTSRGAADRMKCSVRETENITCGQMAKISQPLTLRSGRIPHGLRHTTKSGTVFLLCDKSSESYYRNVFDRTAVRTGNIGTAARCGSAVNTRGRQAGYGLLSDFLESHGKTYLAATFPFRSRPSLRTE